MSDQPQLEPEQKYSDLEFALDSSMHLSDLESVLKIMETMLSKPDITDLMINGRDRIYVEQNGKMLRAPFTIASSELIVQLAEKLAQATGKGEILEHNFVLEGMLPNGSRVTIIMPPASLDSPTISIRRFPKDVFTLDKMIEAGILSPRVRAFLATAVERRANIIISGNTSSGKTTLLNALTTHIPPTDRLVTIEDTPELKVQQENVVRLEIENLSYHNDGRINASARELLKSALRIRPDRIIMGEIRGMEAFDFVQAINTGHKGSMATIHANTPRETITRLEHMVRMGVDLPGLLIRQQLASSLDLLIQTYRNHEGVRRISHITEVVGMEGEVMVTHNHFVYQRDESGEIGYQWERANSRKDVIQQAVNAASAV